MNRLQDEFLKKEDYIEFVKIKFDKIIDTPDYKILVDLISEEIRELKNQLTHLHGSSNLISEHEYIEGQIIAYRNILERPKDFKEALEQIVKKRENKKNVRK